MAEVSLSLTREKAFFAIKESVDWCHICGQRTSPFVELSYSANAEHTIHEVGNDSNPGHYIRICTQCIDACQGLVTIAEAAK